MKKFPVMEHFYTIQGEGVFTGYPAYFIRLAGCDVGCTWCDVKDSWDTSGYTVYSPEEMYDWEPVYEIDKRLLPKTVS